jgi:hypothetical protein
VSLGFGIALGGLAGVTASGIVAIFAALTRRKTTWTIGLAVTALLAGVGFWVLPYIVARLSERTIEYAHWQYGWAYDEAIIGACIGAGLGGLAGSVVMMLVAGDSSRRRGDRARRDPAESPSRPAAGEC